MGASIFSFLFLPCGIEIKLTRDAEFSEKMTFVCREVGQTKYFLPLGELSKRTERDVSTLNSAAKRLQIRFKKDVDLVERMRKL